MILYSPKNNLLQQQQQYQHQMQLQQQQLLENGLTGGVNGAQSQLALESSALGAATASGTAAATSTGLATNVKRETLPHYANKHMMTGGYGYFFLNIFE